MNKQRLSILVISAIGILATFMPWTSTPFFGSMNGINTTIGKLSLIFFIIPLLTCFIGNKINELKKGAHYIIIISSVILVLLDSIQLLVLISKPQSENPFDNFIGEQIRVGFGLYLAIFAGLMLSISLFLMKSKRESDRNETNKLSKRDILLQEKKRKPVSNEKNKVNESSSDTGAELKKPKKFEPSDHSRFMPK